MLYDISYLAFGMRVLTAIVHLDLTVVVFLPLFSGRLPPIFLHTQVALNGQGTLQKICKWGGDYKGKEWFDYVSVKDASYESSATIDEKHCSFTLSYTYNILGSYTNILDDKVIIFIS